MLRFLSSCWRGADPRPTSAPPPPPAQEAVPTRKPLIDVDGMIQQACTRVSVGQLLRKGKNYIQVLSRARMDDLINRAVKTIVDKHRVRGTRDRSTSEDQIEAESRTEFAELIDQYRLTADATSAVALSQQNLEQAFEELRVEPDPAPPAKGERPPDEPRPAPPADGAAREITTLKKRLDKLLAHIATMEAALKTLSTAKTFSNQQIQNLFRDLGISQDDKNLEKKKDMLKIVLSTNQGIRKRGRELEARGITLDAPEETAVFTCAGDSLSNIFTRNSA